MNYTRIYEEFIADRRFKENATKLEYNEKHHIVPTSLGGTNTSDNIIHLSFTDHLFAHELLARIHKTKGMWTAVAMMSNRQKITKRSKLLLEQSRKQVSEMNKGENNVWYNNPVRKGAKHTEETKAKMSKSANHVLKNGKTVAQDRNQKTANKMSKESKIERSLKSAETMRKEGLHEARNKRILDKKIATGSHKIFQLYNEKDELILEGPSADLQKWCKENDASWYTVFDNRKSNERIYANNKRVKDKYKHIIGYKCNIKQL